MRLHAIRAKNQIELAPNASALTPAHAAIVIAAHDGFERPEGRLLAFAFCEKEQQCSGRSENRALQEKFEAAGVDHAVHIERRAGGADPSWIRSRAR